MILLKNGKILTMIGEDIENGYVVIDDSKIIEVGDMTALANHLEGAEDTVIDLGGKVVLPGFIDAHSHLGMWEDGVGKEGDDINEMSDPVTPHLRAVDAVDPLDNCFAEAQKGGVTTVVISPGSANPIAGEISALKTWGRSLEEMIIGTIGMKFALGENPKSVYGENDQAPMSRMATAALIRENLLKTKRYIDDLAYAESEGERHPDLEYKYLCLIPVVERKVRAHFHAHRAYDIETALRISREFNLDCVIIHGTEGHRIADVLAEENAKIICGPIMGTRSKPELSHCTLDNYGILLRHGILAAISSDHPEVPISLLALSAALLLNHGVSERDALLGLTFNAAKIIGLDGRIGAIAAGYDADIQVYDGNPLDIRSKLTNLFINGKTINH